MYLLGLKRISGEAQWFHHLSHQSLIYFFTKHYCGKMMQGYKWQDVCDIESLTVNMQGDFGLWRLLEHQTADAGVRIY